MYTNTLLSYTLFSGWMPHGILTKALFIQPLSILQNHKSNNDYSILGIYLYMSDNPQKHF